MNTIYVLLHDKDKTQKPKIYQSINQDEFKKYNQDGWGVYFSANLFNDRRTKENCAQLRYVFADLDIAKEGDGQTQEEKDAKKNIVITALYEKVVPTLIINTKNGIQPLWKLKDGTPDKKDEYENVIKGIIEWSKTVGCAADAVQDCARILRMPGYYHQKGDPYLCEAKYETGKEYTLEEIKKVFYKEEKKYELPVKQYPLNDVAQAVENIDFQELITRAFTSIGRKAEFDKTGRLILDGRLTGTFQGRKDDRNYLASGSHEPYKGNRTTAVADILGVTNKEAYKWIIEEYGLNFDKVKKQKKIENQISQIKDDETLSIDVKEKRYTWGTYRLDNEIAILKKGNLVILAAKRNMGKTTFSFDMAVKNAKLGHKVLYISLEMSKKDILEALARKYAGITIPEERNYQIPEEKRYKMISKLNEIKSLPSLIFESTRRAEGIIWETVKKIMDDNKADIIFIDNLDCISGNQGEDNNERQKRIVNSLMNYTTANCVPVILIHHYRKGNKATSGMDELAGSGKVADSADIIINLSRRSIEEARADNIQFPETNKTVLWVQKGRGYDDKSMEIYYIDGTFCDKEDIDKNNNNLIKYAQELFGGKIID